MNKKIKSTNIVIDKTIKDPVAIFESEVVKSGNGAVVKARKKYIGKKAIVTILGDK